MIKSRFLHLSACLMLIMVFTRSTTPEPVEDESGEAEGDKVMTKSILANAFYDLLKQKGDTDLSPQMSSSDYDGWFDYSKRSKNSRLAGTEGVKHAYIWPFALRSHSGHGSYKRHLMNEWKRQQRPVCLWKVCPAAPWLVDRR